MFSGLEVISLNLDSRTEWIFGSEVRVWVSFAWWRFIFAQAASQEHLNGIPSSWRPILRKYQGFELAVQPKLLVLLVRSHSQSKQTSHVSWNHTVFTRPDWTVGRRLSIQHIYPPTWSSAPSTWTWSCPASSHWGVWNLTGKSFLFLIFESAFLLNVLSIILINLFLIVCK